MAEKETNETAIHLNNYFDFKIHSNKVEGYRCDICKGSSGFGYNKHFIYKKADILVICLKKFEKSMGGMKKLTNKTSFPKKIDLSQHILSKENE